MQKIFSRIFEAFLKEMENDDRCCDYQIDLPAKLFNQPCRACCVKVVEKSFVKFAGPNSWPEIQVRVTIYHQRRLSNPRSINFAPQNLCLHSDRN